MRSHKTNHNRKPRQHRNSFPYKPKCGEKKHLYDMRSRATTLLTTSSEALKRCSVRVTGQASRKKNSQRGFSQEWFRRAPHHHKLAGRNEENIGDVGALFHCRPASSSVGPSSQQGSVQDNRTALGASIPVSFDLFLVRFHLHLEVNTFLNLVIFRIKTRHSHLFSHLPPHIAHLQGKSEKTARRLHRGKAGHKDLF